MRQSPLHGWTLADDACSSGAAPCIGPISPEAIWVERMSCMCLSKPSPKVCFDCADQARERTGGTPAVGCKHAPSMLNPRRAQTDLNASSRLLVPIDSVAGNDASVQENQKADDAKSNQEPCWSVPGRVCAAGIVGRDCHRIRRN